MKSWCLFFLVLTLNACTSVSVKDPDFVNKEIYEDRTSQLNATGVWGLVGKISLDDGDDGGSGRLQWSVEPGHSELDFHGAMGRGAWHLQIGQDGVRQPGVVHVDRRLRAKARAVGVDILKACHVGDRPCDQVVLGDDHESGVG